LLISKGQNRINERHYTRPKSKGQRVTAEGKGSFR
jgi:hypothetical protein